MADSIEQLSFELIMNALNEQERTLSGLRACAGTVLGAASIAGSFLGARVGHDAIDPSAIVATIAFMLCVASAVWVLLPRGLVLAFGGHRLLLYGDRKRAGEVIYAYRATAQWIERRVQANQRTLDRLADWLTISCAFLTLEIVLWSLSVAS